MIELLTVLLGLGVALSILAVLRAIWGLAARPDPGSAAEPTSAFGWETERNRFIATSDRDRPGEISDLETGASALAGEGSAPRDEPPHVPGAVPGPGVDPSLVLLAGRCLLQLPRAGPPGPPSRGPSPTSLVGLSGALGVPPSSLARVLARLVAGGAVLEVPGAATEVASRSTGYRLTPLGARLAAELRRAGFGPEPGPGVKS